MLWYQLFCVFAPNYGYTNASQIFMFEFFDEKTLNFFLYSGLVALISGSGTISFIGFSLFEISKIIFISSILLAIIFDFFTLLYISSKNQNFLKNFSEKNPQNTKFIIFFILWRIFLPDIFVASSAGAYMMRMNLSKKRIFLLVSGTQILRILFWFGLFLLILM